jgi:hypothetical protein
MPPFDPTTPTAPQPAGNSSEVGYLAWQPVAPQSSPFAGQSLDDFMQQIVAGVTGLEPDLVRPRWQEESPNLPAIGTDWAAVGVTDSRPLGLPYALEDSLPAGQGSQDRADHEEFDVLCSFYGPNADRYATYLREGMFVANNQEPLYFASMAFVDASGRRRVPSLIQQRTMQRVDITLTFRRMVLSTYPVLYFTSASIEVETDTGATSNRTVG